VTGDGTGPHLPETDCDGAHRPLGTSDPGHPDYRPADHAAPAIYREDHTGPSPGPSPAECLHRMSARLSLSVTRRMAGAIALVFAATSVFSLAAPSPAAAWSENAFSAASENELVALTNQSRAAAGRKALKVDSALRSIARWRSKDMIQRDYFSHDIPGYGRVFDVMSDKGYCYHIAGENIGWNNASDGTATQKVHNAFMDSSGHRSNILGKSWDVIGIGAYKGENGKKMWTVIFADRCGSVKPKPAPKPKPKATAKPKPKPVVRATPKPTKKPTPKPVATPTQLAPSGDQRSFDPEPESASPPTDEPPDATEPEASPDDTADIGGAHGLRVLEPDRPPGLVDTIVGDVTGFFLGS
jgi:uncharacterized protein YkwD